MTSARWLGMLMLAPAVLLLGGCEGIQSALAPGGPDAGRIARLGWLLFGGSAVILVGVMALTGLAMSGSAKWRERLGHEAIVIAGGIVFPVVTLTGLLAYGLVLMQPGVPAAAAGGAMRIAVVGERYWWRVIYRDRDGQRFESANELRIPTGRTIEIELTTADVIHSFWVPKLAGKLDMIPGRRNVLRLAANAPGVSRGQCAEYCGGAHALMSFHVVALAEDEFQAWLAREALPATPPAGAVEQQGMLAFLSYGCGACHAIRGTAAAGTIGPDLTHVGGRLSLAAATLPNDEAALARFITDSQHVKPENLMPPFRILGDHELAALTRYLTSLK